MKGSLIEGFIAIYRKWFWIVRGLETYKGRFAAFPRYPVSALNEKKLENPRESLAKAMEIDGSIIDYMPCMGRRVPLLGAESALMLDPLSYKPKDTPLHIKAYELLVKLRKHSGIDTIGVTGGLLAGRSKGDIDLVVYGKRESQEIYSLLENRSLIQSYAIKEAYSLMLSRGERVITNELLRRETHKRLQGKYRGTDVYIRLIPKYPWDERECDYTVEKRGEILVKAKIIDNSAGMLYPCTYYALIVRGPPKLIGEKIEIKSSRGRYCERAYKGEYVVCRGELEIVEKGGQKKTQIFLWDNNHYLLPLGGRMN